MRYCSSSLFSSSVDQIKGSSCISCSWACYWCIEHGLLLSILSSSFLVSSFVVSIAHWSGGHLGVQFFGHLSLSRGSALSLLFFFYISVHLCVKSREAQRPSVSDRRTSGSQGNNRRSNSPGGGLTWSLHSLANLWPPSLCIVVTYNKVFHSVVFDCIGDYSMNLLLYIYCF